MKRYVFLVAALLIAFAQHGYADYHYIVRVDGDLRTVQQICTPLGCGVTRGLDGALGQLFLVRAPDGANPDVFLQTLLSQRGVVGAELDIPISLSPGPRRSIPGGLTDARPYYFFGKTVWNGYANQPGALMVGLESGRSKFDVSGSGVVAVIDTGVDPDHPALRDVLITGYDFTRNTAGIPNEVRDLTQPVSPTVSGVPPAYVNESTAAVVDQNTAVVLSQYRAFGHGTMVSGVIHMVAPKAMIMPLKVFRADGSGALSDAIRAIHYGVQNGAKVLNMSFSTSAYSKELKRAVDYAVNNGAICVSSAGNDGKEILVYPAALDNVMGIASTDYQDQRSSFSNYGKSLVWIAAPGETIISTYPFSTYAESTGTSFSAPFVSGVAALFLDLRANTNQTQAAQALSSARKLSDDLGYGRLDVYQALAALKALR
jgi:subtilisin family serine protease